MRFAASFYLLVSLALVLVSYKTGRRATELSGDEHYLLTRTSVLVKQKVEPKNATDAALDAAFEEAGESTEMFVEQPVFVLGMLDAVAPSIFLGGLVVSILWWRDRRRRRARQAASGIDQPSEL